jgi:hypothetical protein
MATHKQDSDISTMVFLSNLVQHINIATVCIIVYSVLSKHTYDNTVNLLRKALSLPTCYANWYGKYDVRPLDDTS